MSIPIDPAEVAPDGLEEGQMRAADPLAADALFHIDMPPPVSLRDRFGLPPFSVLDRRSGLWQDRKRQWLSLGIRSELGRDSRTTSPYGVRETGWAAGNARKHAETGEANINSEAPPPSRPPGGGHSPLWIYPSGSHGDEDRYGRSRNKAFGVQGPFPSSFREAAKEHAETGEPTLPQKADTSKAAPPRPGGGGGGFWLGKTADGRTAPGDPQKYSGRASETGLLYKSPTSRDPDYYRKKTEAERVAGRALTLEEFERDYYIDDDVAPAYETGTSIFDPVVCELVYRWFAGPDALVLDPFAGGSVRGIAASYLERRYFGIDLRPEQVEANRAQCDLLREDMWEPVWAAGDASEVLAGPGVPPAVDLVFSCPPYADLEQYSDDPRDLSNMRYGEFRRMHALIIRLSCERLRNDRFAAWVISDVRDKTTPGSPYRGLVADTVRAFEEAGLRLYNDCVILDNVGSGAMRAAGNFQKSRKLVRMHQHLLVFVKGDPRVATEAAGGAL